MIGYGQITEDGTAYFKCVLGNDVDYYESGGLYAKPARSKYRPMWARSDLGYLSPSMTLRVVPGSLKNGLFMGVVGAADMDIGAGFGLTMPHGKKVLLLHVTRGPFEHEYPARGPPCAYCASTLISA